ncbi:excisionase family protein [Salmonella enterica subsp. enterica]|nr:excisionase family protein [Salmonella enterica subsp. enterica]
MQTIVQLVPNEWVTDKLLIAVTGPGNPEPFYGRARNQYGCSPGGSIKHVAPDGHPKPTSECLYHIPTINR